MEWWGADGMLSSLLSLLAVLRVCLSVGMVTCVLTGWVERFVAEVKSVLDVVELLTVGLMMGLASEESFEAEGGSVVGIIMVESCVADGKPELEVESMEEEENWDTDGILPVVLGNLTGGVETVKEESCEAEGRLVMACTGVSTVVEILVVSFSNVVLRSLGGVSVVMVVVQL